MHPGYVTVHAGFPCNSIAPHPSTVPVLSPGRRHFSCFYTAHGMHHRHNQPYETAFLNRLCSDLQTDTWLWHGRSAFHTSLHPPTDFSAFPVPDTTFLSVPPEDFPALLSDVLHVRIHSADRLPHPDMLQNPSSQDPLCPCFSFFSFCRSKMIQQNLLLLLIFCFLWE